MSDAPPVEPSPRISVVRQLEEDEEEQDEQQEDEGERSQAMSPEPIDSPRMSSRSVAATGGSASSRGAHVEREVEVEPSQEEMEELPGDEEEAGGEAEAEEEEETQAVSQAAAPEPTPAAAAKPKAKAAASSSSSTKAKASTAASKTPSKTPSKAPSKVASKAPSKQNTPRSRPSLAPSSDSSSSAPSAPLSPPGVEVHAIIPDAAAPVLKPKAKQAPPKPLVVAAEQEAKEDSKPAAAKPKIAGKTPVKAIAKAAAAPSPKPASTKKSVPPSPRAPVKAAAVEPSTTTAASAFTLQSSNFNFEEHETLSALTDANRSLTALLAKRQEENTQLADALLTLQSELEVAEKGGGVAVSKELAKKNRELNLQLSKERAGHLQQIELLKKQHSTALEEARAGSNAKGPASPKKPLSGFGSTISKDSNASPDPATSPEVLEAKVASLQKQYLEKSNEVSALQAKVKQLCRVVVKEVDETGHMKPDEMLDEKFLGKFKGRAQKIALLKDKVRDLEKQLANATSGSPSNVNANGVSVERSSSSMSDNSQAPPTHSVHDFHESTLHRMAADRKNELGELRTVVDNQTKELENQRSKYVSIKARNKNLEEELKNLKEKARTLFEKSTHDDEIIDSLKTMFENTKRSLEEKEKELKLVNANGPTRIPSATHARPVGSGPKLGNGQDLKIAEQEKIINALREEVKKFKSGAKGNAGPPMSPASSSSHKKQSSSTSSSSAAASPDYTRSHSSNSNNAPPDAFHRSETEAQLNLQRLENTKLRELLSNHAARLSQAEKELLDTKRKLLEAQRENGPLTTETISRQLKGTGGAQVSARSMAARHGGAAQLPSENVATLRSQLASALSEQRLIQESYATTLANKENDIAILNEILNQKNQLYLSNMAELKKKYENVAHSLAAQKKAAAAAAAANANGM